MPSWNPPSKRSPGSYFPRGRSAQVSVDQARGRSRISSGRAPRRYARCVQRAAPDRVGARQTEERDANVRNGDEYGGGDGRRSAEWLERRDLDGFLHRSWLKSEGFSNDSPATTNSVASTIP